MGEWKRVKLGEIIECFDSMRKPLSSIQRSAFQGQYRYYGAQEVIDYVDGYIFDGTYVLIAEDGENLISRKKPIAQIVSGRFWLNNHAHIFKANEKSDLRYLCYFLNSSDITYYVTGSAQPKLSRQNLDSIELDLPPLPTQRRIAAVLGALDDKIEVNRKICENLEAQAQALFKAWFVDFEPFGGKRPEGWKMMPVEELTERMASGGTPKTKIEAYYDGTTKWFSTKELKDCFLFDSEKHISKEAVENSAAKVFPRDTVLMAIYAAPTVGRLGIMDEEGTFNQAAVGMVAKKYVGYPFLFLTLLAEREGLNLMAVGSCQQNLNVGVVKSYKVLLPDEKVLSRFNESIMPMFDEIRTLSKESRALAAMRDSLLPKLMSGELAVEKVEGF